MSCNIDMVYMVHVFGIRGTGEASMKTHAKSGERYNVAVETL